jgi:hypothetical protein
MKLKDAFKVSSLPVIFASLCCLSPLILVAVGLSTVSFATSLADTFYGEYKWWFRAFGLVALAIAVTLYLRRKKGICTLDEAKKRRQEIINTVLLTLIAGVIGYVVFLYGIVHYAGVWLDIWPDYGEG